MTKSKRSSAPPEFFVDRGLGKLVPQGLVELGWTVHLITEHFPDDAQQVPDEEWIEYGLVRGWVPLSKDGKIRSRPAERQPLVDHNATLFYLDSAQLVVAEMVRRFHAAQSKIHKAARRDGPAAYAVRSSGIIVKRWP
ncbi:PIN-like domain-containing protein [Nocardia brasiliensis]